MQIVPLESDIHEADRAVAGRSASTVTVQGDGVQRVHYLDNLRALAMLLGVFLHAALAYAEPAQEIWLATDARSSIAIDAAIWFIHLFRMSLFFLLSGYFANLVIARKGLRKFAANRLLRLVLPFALFYIPLLVAITAVIVFAIAYLESPQGLMGYIAEVANQAGEGAAADPPGTMHLWFLYYLIFFNAIAIALACNPWQRLIGHRLGWLAAGEWWIRPWVFPFLPLALVPAVLAVGTPLPAPESLMPTWWPFLFYGGFYWWGWHLYGRERVLQALAPFAWPLLFGCIVLYIPYYLCLPTIDLSLLVPPDEGGLPHPRWNWTSLVAAFLNGYLAVALTLVALLLGQRCLSQHRRWWRFVADSSYWIYLVHLPIVVFLQTLLIPWDVNVWAKLSIVIGTTLGLSLATYVVFVRYTPLGWMLNGKKTFP